MVVGIASCSEVVKVSGGRVGSDGSRAGDCGGVGGKVGNKSGRSSLSCELSWVASAGRQLFASSLAGAL